MAITTDINKAVASVLKVIAKESYIPKELKNININMGRLTFDQIHKQIINALSYSDLNRVGYLIEAQNELNYFSLEDIIKLREFATLKRTELDKIFN